MVFVDHPENPNYPNLAFARAKLPCMAFPWHGESNFSLAAEESLNLRYKILLLNGKREFEEIREIALQ